MDQDEFLIKSAQKGNRDAFGMLVDRYKAIVFAICMNITRDYHEAENLAQETFIQVYRSLDQYESRGFKTWIGRIATNKAIDWKRRKKAEGVQQVVYLDDMDVPASKEEDDLNEQLSKKENRRKIISICDELPEKYSVVLKKYYMQSKSYKQISQEEGISIKTVESRLYRAKKSIRERWGEEEPYEAL